MQRLEQVRGEFREMLWSTTSVALVTRFSADRWSPVETVRHLVFAEDLYLNRWILRNDAAWNELGLLPGFLVGNHEYSDAGSQLCNDLEAVPAARDDSVPTFRSSSPT